MKRYKCAHSDCEAVKEKDPCVLTFGDDPVIPDRCPFGYDKEEFIVWKKARMTTDAVKILKKRYLRKKQ